MKLGMKTVLVGGVLLCLSAVSQAQSATGGQGPQGGQNVQGGPGASGDMRANMQDRMRQHAADLKAKLKLAPEQEGTWTSYMAAMKPPADMQHPQRGDMEKLSTPERLDKMREQRKQHEAQMDKRDDATRTFYATLSAEQKTVFDAQHRGQRRGPGQEQRKP